MTQETHPSQYLGAAVDIESNDPEHLEYLQAAGRGEFVLQRCTDCEHLRYPIGNACPFCTSLAWQWAPVSGRGTIYSYEVVTHPIHPSFRGVVPYVIALVELDEQRGVPGPHDGVRVLGMLVDAEGNPESEDRAGINVRVQVDFADLGGGLALPRFRLSDEPSEHPVWRFA